MFNSPRRYHIVPANDLREHELTPECWCKPTPDEEHDVFTRHAMDGRETFETNERKPS